MTSPGRSARSASVVASRRCGRSPGGAAPSPARRPGGAARRTRRSRRGGSASTPAYPARASVLRSIRRASPTTDRSAWNCANDCSSSSRAAADAEPADQVDGHVVAGPEASCAAGRCGSRPARRPAAGPPRAARPPRRGPRRRCRGGPARPVSWVYSPGVSSACASPLNLTSRSSTTVRAGMLMPSARVSVANTARTRPRTNSSSTVSLNAGSMPGVVRGDAALQRLAPLPVAQHAQVGLRQVARCGARRSRGSRRPRPRWSAAARPARTGRRRRRSRRG